jgi:hypothetical protein
MAWVRRCGTTEQTLLRHGQNTSWLAYEIEAIISLIDPETLWG